MRQRLSRLKHLLRDKCPRTYKIIDKSTDMLGWTPIIIMVYSQILLLSYAYYKSECKRHDNVND
jgi:hypothetical protein